jgi:hypothetical protein
MTVAEFLKTWRVLTGTVFSFTKGNVFGTPFNYCEVHPIKVILDDPSYIDMTDKVVDLPANEPGEIRKKGIAYDFPKPESDALESKDLIKAETVQSIANLPVVTQANENTYCLVIDKNRYYKVVYDAVNDNAFWEVFEPPVESYTLGAGGLKLESKLAPVQNENEFFYEYTFDRLENNGGNARLFTSAADIRKYNFDVLIWQFKVQDREDEYDPEQLYSITGHGGDYVDTNLPYIENMTSLRVILRRGIPSIIPDLKVKAQLTLKDKVQSNPNLVAYWHGYTPNSIGNDIPFASANNYRSNGAQLSSLALRWDSQHGIRERYYSEFENFMENTQLVSFRLRLTIADIINFNPVKKWRIRGNNYFVKNIKVTMTMNGLMLSEVQLWKT